MRWAIDSFVRLTEEAFIMRLLGADAIDSSSWDLVAAELLRLRGGRVDSYTSRDDEPLPDGRVSVVFGASECRRTSHFYENEFEQITREEYFRVYRV